MATNFSPCRGSYVLNQFPSNVMFGMNGFHVSASGAIQGHRGPLVLYLEACECITTSVWPNRICVTFKFTNLGEKDKECSGVFSPLTSAEACEKSSRWLWKEKLFHYWCEKARKHICVTDSHDMTLAVKVALNPNTTNQPTNQSMFLRMVDEYGYCS